MYPTDIAAHERRTASHVEAFHGPVASRATSSKATLDPTREPLMFGLALVAPDDGLLEGVATGQPTLSSPRR